MAQESTNKLRDIAKDLDANPPRVSVPPRSMMGAAGKAFSQIPPEHRIFAVLILALLAGAYMLRDLWT